MRDSYVRPAAQTASTRRRTSRHLISVPRPQSEGERPFDPSYGTALREMVGELRTPLRELSEFAAFASERGQYLLPVSVRLIEELVVRTGELERFVDRSDR